MSRFVDIVFHQHGTVTVNTQEQHRGNTTLERSLICYVTHNQNNIIMWLGHLHTGQSNMKRNMHHAQEQKRKTDVEKPRKNSRVRTEVEYKEKKETKSK